MTISLRANCCVPFVMIVLVWCLLAPAKAQSESQPASSALPTSPKDTSASDQALRDEFIKLQAELAQIEQQTAALTAQFEGNEQTISEKRQALQLASHQQTELYGVVRQSASALQASLPLNLITARFEDERRAVDDIVDARSLPTWYQFEALWQAYQQFIFASGAYHLEVRPVTELDGTVSDKPVIHVGWFGIADELGYLQWDSIRQTLTPYAAQPPQPLTVDQQGSLSTGVMLDLDPTQGQLLAQLGTQLSVGDRLAQGGIVGKVILVLFGIGLVIGLFQYGWLWRTKAKIQQQLRCLETPSTENPLGRILAIYKQDVRHNIQALELRLLEGVMQEQSVLERGLSMIKLLAALAPMLGLLGTVTGMIETFQTITLYGNSDPKIMAGGISTALVTTVLGLMAAMPLLVLHNLLSTQVESIRNIIEKQGIAIVAEHAERQLQVVEEH